MYRTCSWNKYFKVAPFTPGDLIVSKYSDFVIMNKNVKYL